MGTNPMADVSLEFAKTLHAEVWDLLEKPERTDSENELMIHAAHASCYHWLHVGTGLNHQRGEWLIARVYTVLELADSALRHAVRCLELTDEYSDLMRDFDRAFAYEAVARANALARNHALSQKHLQLAEESGQAIQDAEDRSIFLAELHSGNWYNLS